MGMTNTMLLDCAFYDVESKRTASLSTLCSGSGRGCTKIVFELLIRIVDEARKRRKKALQDPDPEAVTRHKHKNADADATFEIHFCALLNYFFDRRGSASSLSR